MVAAHCKRPLGIPKNLSECSGRKAPMFSPGSTDEAGIKKYNNKRKEVAAEYATAIRKRPAAMRNANGHTKYCAASPPIAGAIKSIDAAAAMVSIGVFENTWYRTMPRT